LAGLPKPIPALMLGLEAVDLPGGAGEGRLPARAKWALSQYVTIR
jgi:hypothetical protein